MVKLLFYHKIVTKGSITLKFAGNLHTSFYSVYMLRPDSQPLTRFEAGRPASKRVSVSSFKAGQI